MENHYLISALETLKECNFEFNKPIHILYLNLHLSMHKFLGVHEMKRLATYCNYIKYIYIYIYIYIELKIFMKITQLD